MFTRYMLLAPIVLGLLVSRPLTAREKDFHSAENLQFRLDQFLVRYRERGNSRTGYVNFWTIVAIVFALPGLVAGGLAVYVGFFPDKGILGVLGPVFVPYAFPVCILFAWVTLRFLSFAAESHPLRWFLPIPSLIAAALCLYPIAGSLVAAGSAEADFRAAYSVPAADITSPLFRSSPFSLYEFLCGSVLTAEVEKKNVVYHSETAADGRTYDFAFSYFASTAPGPKPVLIRIHGGAWVSGDIDSGNMGRMNRYFANTGMAVFDVQYGLNDTAEFSLRAPTPEAMLGDFSIDDMIRQIGLFSTYLVEHAAEFDADITRVFLSGGSAGGQLVLALALSGPSGFRSSHPGLGLDPAMTVRGVIPFYPAIGSASRLGIPGDPSLVDPTRLLSGDNPPMLVYQGAVDGLVPLSRTVTFTEAYRASGTPAQLIVFPGAGHGSDVNFWDPFNQVFLFYMERFIALYSR